MDNNQSIILYSTGCPVCNMLKMRLDKAGIKYSISYDSNAIFDMGFRTAPILSVDGRLMQSGEAIKWINSGCVVGDGNK